MSERPRFLLIKRGLYYRPDSRGYTGKKSEAGRYLEGEASIQNGVQAVHEDDAAEYAPACWMETKLADKDARIAELEQRLGGTRAALQDIADAEAIPDDAVAFIWCRDVARAGLSAEIGIKEATS